MRLIKLIIALQRENEQLKARLARRPEEGVADLQSEVQNLRNQLQAQLDVNKKLSGEIKNAVT